MKKTLSAILAFSIAASACSVFQASAAAGDVLLNSTFEDGLGGWSARGSATVAVSSEAAASGSKSAAVTGRGEAWNGIAYALDSATFPAGSTISVSANILQRDSAQGVTFKLTVEYNGGNQGGNPGGGWPGGMDWPGGGDFNFGGNTGFELGGGGNAAVMADGDAATYDTFAEKLIPAGMWNEISKEGYVIGSGSNPILYIETDTSKCDFFVDDIVITSGSTIVKPQDPPDDPPTPSGDTLRGDVNKDKKVDKKDVDALVSYLLTKSEDIDGAGADVDSNNKVNAADLSKLKDLILNPPPVVTTTTPAPVVTTTTAPNVNHKSAKEYNEMVAKDFQRNVPGNVKSGDKGKTDQGIQYFSKKANRNKKCNIWTPPGYDSSKKYPVMFMNHGVMGSENDMLQSSWAVREMASNLIQSGDAVPFIIVFANMYTDPKSASPSFNFNMDMMDAYDNFLYDVKDSLYPYVCEHYSVATGRENTAIAGFSMGGRESLYLSLMLPDMFGYCCASSPAPGIVPASDRYISNHLGSLKLDGVTRMKNSDFKFSDADLPYILMIGGGTNDDVVGTFPKEYHQIFDSNGTTNIWQEFQGSGHDASVGVPLFYNFFRYVFKA